ncbi:MAG TPA: amidohydrolase family protein [Acidimicrobiia bacterium]|jgi:N-acyl-D-aspartate/D-glutamate deacylase
MVADIVIRGGTVVDGSGSPGYRADVAVEGNTITEIGSELHGRRELDASGHVVAPGFIDIHSHYDAQVFWDPALTPSSFHGVTTVVAGNCGFSIAPVRPEHRELLVKTLMHVEDMSPDTLFAGVPWDAFETFPEYLDAVESRGTVLNYACYVGHTALRMYVMGGDDAYSRAATPDEVARMQQLVAEALAAGAAGVATSASPTHNGEGGRPVPSRVADIDELRALLMPMRDAGRGVGALLPAGVIPEDTVFDLQREVGRPFTWTALLTIKGSDYYRRTIEANDAARERGIEVWPQVSCRPLTFQMNLREPFTFNTRPSFAALMDTSDEVRMAAYRDPQWRATTWEQMNGRGFLTPQWANITVAESATRPELVGVTVADAAAAAGANPLDFMLDLALSENLDTRFGSVLANNDDEGIAFLLPRDNVLFGLADSGAHVSQLCDACFATDLLGNWVREREVMPLERAVHKLTAEPAGVYGFDDRGSIEVGKRADIAVFDPDTVSPGPLHRIRDFPADGERLTADSPIGMAHTLVNGVAIRVDGKNDADAINTRPGQTLRG